MASERSGVVLRRVMHGRGLRVSTGIVASTNDIDRVGTGVADLTG